jgi:hypothetical protein
MKQLAARLAFVAAGAVVGIAASVTVSWLRPQPPGASSSAPGKGELTALDERLAALERAADGADARRLVERAPGRERAASPTDADVEARSTAVDPPRSDEEEAAEAKARFTRNQEAFAATLVDPDWSRRALEKVGGGLAGAKEALGFELARLECRDRNCLVQLDWQNVADAHRGVADLVHATPGMNCAADAVVEANAESDEGISTTILLRNCEDES